MPNRFPMLISNSRCGTIFDGPLPGLPFPRLILTCAQELFPYEDNGSTNSTTTTTDVAATTHGPRAHDNNHNNNNSNINIFIRFHHSINDARCVPHKHLIAKMLRQLATASKQPHSKKRIKCGTMKWIFERVRDVRLFRSQDEPTWCRKRVVAIIKWIQIALNAMWRITTKNGRNFNIRRLSIEIDAAFLRMRKSYYTSHSMIKKRKKCPTSTQRYLLCDAMGYRWPKQIHCSFEW